MNPESEPKPPGPDLEHLPRPTVGNWALLEDGFTEGRAARLWRHRHRDLQVLAALQVRENTAYIRLSVMSSARTGPTPTEVEFARRGFTAPQGEPTLTERRPSLLHMWFEIPADEV